MIVLFLTKLILVITKMVVSSNYPVIGALVSDLYSVTEK